MRRPASGRAKSKTRLGIDPLEDRLTPAVTVRFDYTYDTSGFFADADRKAALDRAAVELTADMADDLAAIVPSGGNSWVAFTSRPDTGASLNLPNLTIAEGEVLIFVGARPLPGATIGQAMQFTPSGSATGSDDWKDLVRARSQAGALGASPTDTALWGGSIVFDAEEDWYFGADADGVPFGSSDFQTTALHELIHLFGFADSNLAFRRYVSGYTFTGPVSVAEHGGPVPTEEVFLQNSVTGEFIRTAPSHWSQEVLSQGRSPTMTPASTNGVRSPFTSLDRAALRDIGWEIVTPPTVSDPADRLVVVGTTGIVVAFTVGDEETPAADLIVNAATSDPTLVPLSGIVLGGSGASRTATINPVAGLTGTTTITLTVSEPGGGSATTSFTFTVTEPGSALSPTLIVAGPGGSGVATAAADGSYPAPVPSFNPLGAGGNVRTAAADVNGDGSADSILVSGPGKPIRVAVVSGADNSTILVPPFDPFGGDFTGGGFVAAADIDGDGKAEFVVTPDQGGGPRVTIFSLVGGDAVGVRANFLGIDDAAFRGGARPAVGDVNKDGVPDLLVAAGFGGGPRVALFGGSTLFTTRAKLVNDFFAFPDDATTLRNGVFATIGDISGDGYADLVFGGGPGGAPRVYILSGEFLMSGNPNLFSQPVANFFVAGNANDRGGVRLAVKNADGDTKADLVVGSGEGSPAKVRIYLGTNFVGTGEPGTFQDLSVFGGVPLIDGVFVG